MLVALSRPLAFLKGLLGDYIYFVTRLLANSSLDWDSDRGSIPLKQLRFKPPTKDWYLSYFLYLVPVLKATLRA